MKNWINKNEPAYKWELIEHSKHSGYDLYLIHFISQSWRDINEVEQVDWQHPLKIIVPNNREQDSALLMIEGGTLENENSNIARQNSIDWAIETQSVVVELSVVPNQPLRFKGETDERYQEKGRTEDQIIAYTWDKYFKTKDKSWPLQVPMTKAAIKAMDCVEEFSKANLDFIIDKFAVCGLSKRGWTSWLVAAYDKRVIAVVPMVIDLLNLRESFSHHFDVYGRWAGAIKDYEDIGIQNWVYTEEFSSLLDLIEPFHYRSLLTMPKYIVNSSGDEFFLPDSSKFYFEELLEPKYLRYVPNCPHNLFLADDAMQAAGAFYQMVVEKKALPQFSWVHKHPNQVELECIDEPIEINLWQAHNPETRDFRYLEVGAIWKKELISKTSNSKYLVDLKTPQKGWQAYFIELKYSSLQKQPLVFTTDVYIMSHEIGV